MEFKTICSFQLPHTAHLAKSKLESEGIEVQFKDEFTVQSHNFLSNAIGGIKLQVQEPDIKRATSILKDSGYQMEKSIIKIIPFISKLETFSNEKILVFVFLGLAIIASIIAFFLGDNIIKPAQTEPHITTTQNHLPLKSIIFFRTIK